MQPVYLDHNATSPLRPEAEAALLTALKAAGNPSSVHGAGRAARERVEHARAEVAALVGASPSQVVFTSGGTEADNLALVSLAAAGPCTLIISAIEHEAVAECAKTLGVAVDVLPVDGEGVARLDWLAERLDRWTEADGRPMLALMLANNETGVIQPVAEAAQLIHQRGGQVHVDAVQAAGRIALDLAALGADSLALSAHKLGGPQGVGALITEETFPLKRQLHGGGQERGLRAGTENVAGIAGFGAAATAALRDLHLAAEQAVWRDAAAERLKAEAGVLVAGEGAPRLANTLCLAAEDFPSHLQVMALDLAGVMVSAGAACSSGKVKPSGVLAAMGYSAERAGSVLRVSGGWTTREADWNLFVEAWLEAWRRRVQRRVKEFA
jgi:cysteine desulfurase